MNLSVLPKYGERLQYGIDLFAKYFCDMWD